MRPNAAVTAGSSAAVKAGIDILRVGGNAVDAAVSAALAACVAEPADIGIGGFGGEMVVADAKANAWSVSFGMAAPKSANVKDAETDLPDTGAAASGVPMIIAGLSRALDDFGTLPWARVTQRAAELAASGVRVPADTARTLVEIGQSLDATNGEDGTVAIKQRALARTLEALAVSGPHAFYEGKIGAAACEAFAAAGILLSREEWAEGLERVEITRAPSIELDGWRVFSGPLRTSGAPCLLANLSAMAEISNNHGLETASGLAELAKIMSAVWQYRFSEPARNNITAETLEAWMANAVSFQSSVTPLRPNAGHTTHINAIDFNGVNAAVSLSYGPQLFGARWVLPDTGVLMNDGMHLFRWEKPVVRRGRNLGITSLSPAVAVRAAGGSIAIGSPGSRRIPSKVGLTLGRRIIGGMPIDEAVRAGRIHAEDALEVRFEKERLPEELSQQLQRMFPKVLGETDLGGPVNALAADVGGQVTLGLDNRNVKGFGEVLI